MTYLLGCKFVCSPPVTKSGIGGCESFPYRFSTCPSCFYSIMHLRALEATGSYREAAWKLRRIHSGTGFHRHAVRFAALRLDLGL